jgi:hypothetical protein
VPLPTHGARDSVDGCALGSLQHRDHRILLRRRLRVGLLIGVRQGLDRRPQLIDQRVAVTDFLSLLDIGQSVPSASNRLPLSWAACNSSFEATTISPLFTAAGASLQRVIPSLPMTCYLVQSQVLRGAFNVSTNNGVTKLARWALGVARRSSRCETLRRHRPARYKLSSHAAGATARRPVNRSARRSCAAVCRPTIW